MLKLYNILLVQFNTVRLTCNIITTCTQYILRLLVSYYFPEVNSRTAETKYLHIENEKQRIPIRVEMIDALVHRQRFNLELSQTAG